jgi:Flp pilus assembly protein TadD
MTATSRVFEQPWLLTFEEWRIRQRAKYLRRAVKISPQQQRYWNNLGLVEVQRENFDEATTALHERSVSLKAT